YSWSDYLSTIDNRGWRWRSTGDLQTHRLGLSHVLFRNPGQALAGGLNPAVAQLIKQATGDNREANLMVHAVWGALAAQLGGNNAASGAAGAFSGELAARYIIDN
ncbi:ShlB/FhaC/HecB family hemolysin secretion/activation protein, partial [Escherichia coli]|nr:ShlB/FhaC/HecB family hemolysin secretion/activation protein [Escherichia coli]